MGRKRKAVRALFPGVDPTTAHPMDAWVRLLARVEAGGARGCVSSDITVCLTWLSPHSDSHGV